MSEKEWSIKVIVTLFQVLLECKAQVTRDGRSIKIHSILFTQLHYMELKAC